MNMEPLKGHTVNVDQIRDLIELVMAGEPINQFVPAHVLMVEIMAMTGLPASLILATFIRHAMMGWSHMHTTPDWLLVTVGQDAFGAEGIGMYRLHF